VTVVTLPSGAVDALADGKTIQVKSPDFGRSGYNGTVTLRQRSEGDEPETWVSVKEVDS